MQMTKKQYQSEFKKTHKKLKVIRKILDIMEKQCPKPMSALLKNLGQQFYGEEYELESYLEDLETYWLMRNWSAEEFNLWRNLNTAEGV